ncbi:hypothetical protein J6590_075458 [Homalodisca vitripennis]|nr:hypothetical protein J6590_075458 [Homalodisca vitripennis]
MAACRTDYYECTLVIFGRASEEPTEDGGCAKEKSCDFNDCKDGEECYLLNGEPTCRPCSSTCEGVQCPEGQECILEVVQCFVPPCCPIPTCTPTDNSSSCPDEKEQTCDGIDCGKQKECIILDGIPTCVQELTCATINCIAGYTCVDRKCILDPCFDYECPDGEECYLEDVPCTHPPCRVPSCRPIDKFDSSEDEECVKEQTCEGIHCGEQEECVILDGIPTCIPELTCASIDCVIGYTCVDKECILNPCFDYQCPCDQECYLQDVPCTEPPCRVPSCRPIDKCATVRCKGGYICQDGECIPELTCDNVECKPGEQCYLEDIPCLVPPCPQRPVCRPDKCAIIRCRGGYICQDGECIPELTCDNVECKPGEQCYLEDIPCLVPPCPQRPVCRPDKCSAPLCPEGTVLADGECVTILTCRGYECPPGEECYLEEVVCVKAPCFPIPSCRPRACSPSSPCNYGRVCINGRCVTKATCQDFECPPGQECYLVESSCRRPPCPPGPSCRPPPTCDVVHCPPGYLCSEGRCILGPSCKG